MGTDAKHPPPFSPLSDQLEKERKPLADACHEVVRVWREHRWEEWGEVLGSLREEAARYRYEEGE